MKILYRERIKLANELRATARAFAGTHYRIWRKQPFRGPSGRAWESLVREGELSDPLRQHGVVK